MSLIQKGVKELRFIMCQNSSTSQGVRSFVLNNYAAIKGANPEFPFIVRESKGAQACVTARYEFGVERRIYL